MLYSNDSFLCLFMFLLLFGFVGLWCRSELVSTGEAHSFESGREQLLINEYRFILKDKIDTFTNYSAAMLAMATKTNKNLKSS